jgi:phosphoesterase RecJ-like protein
VLVSLSLREEEDAGIKFSLRSWGDVDVQAIALHFGGGGHVNASGGSIASTLADAEQRLVEAIARYLPPKTAARTSPSLAATWHYDN